MAHLTIKPVAAVSVCVVRKGMVLLVKRKKQIARDLWSLPGGSVELGEAIREAALRELFEETGVTAELIRLLDCVDIINKSTGGRITSHYILSVFGARWLEGEAQAGDDAAAVQWIRPQDLDGLAMTAGTAALIQRVFPSLAAA